MPQRSSWGNLPAPPASDEPPVQPLVSTSTVSANATSKPGRTQTERKLGEASIVLAFFSLLITGLGFTEISPFTFFVSSLAQIPWLLSITGTVLGVAGRNAIGILLSCSAFAFACVVWFAFILENQPSTF